MRGNTTGAHAAAVAVVLLSVVLFSGCTLPADAEPDGPVSVETPFDAGVAGRLDAALAEAMTLSGSSGALAGVWAPWAGEWVVAPGTTTLGGSEPLTTDMRYRIGDNTRSMTCTVLLRLVDDGVVKLSDPASDYLDRITGIDGITLGQLCQNTSGLPDYTTGLLPHFVNNPEREWPPLEVLSSGLAGARLGEPGATVAPSRTGLVLLGMALEAATEKDWQTLYRQYIFDPLGMDDSVFPRSAEVEIPGPHPHGYAAALTTTGQTVCETVRDETRLSPSMGWVAGGVVSDLSDMKVWAEAVAQGRLLSEEAAEAQWATVSPGEGSPPWQGYGLGVQQLGPLRGDAGTIPGYLSAMFSDPASGLTVVVMLNNSHAGAPFVQALAQRMASIAASAPAAAGEEAVSIELPWTEEEMTAVIQGTPVCPPGAAAPAS